MSISRIDSWILNLWTPSLRFIASRRGQSLSRVTLQTTQSAVCVCVSPPWNVLKAGDTWFAFSVHGSMLCESRGNEVDHNSEGWSGSIQTRDQSAGGTIWKPVGLWQGEAYSAYLQTLYWSLTATASLISYTKPLRSQAAEMLSQGHHLLSLLISLSTVKLEWNWLQAWFFVFCKCEV